MNPAILLVFILIPVQAVLNYNDKTTADRIRAFGYSSETHTVTTEDGYVLTLFRITTPRNPIIEWTPRPVVLLMHGVLSSSDAWVINGPEDALAFNLVDSGYDVWLGNSRGTPYGYRHVTLAPTERSFWRFSIHELGTVDLPLIIDYILERARQPRLHYVGHSQGTCILLILLSTQPQYSAKIKTSHLLAPIAFMKHASSPIIQFLSPLFRVYTPLNPLIGDRPLLQSRLVRTIMGFVYCHSPHANPDLCSHILFILGGGFTAYFNNSLLPDVFTTHPASCSTNQLIHLVQLHVSGHFHPYNYGLQGNLQRYGQSVPPKYKLRNIKTQFPMHLYYSDYDELSSKADVERLSRIMGNQTVGHFIGRRFFAHIDFLWASIVREEINQVVLDVMYDAEVSMQ